MFRHWRHRRRSLRHASNSRRPVLTNYLECSAHLDVGHIANTPMIAVDFELTGLDRHSDHIIAMGWTTLDEGRIRFSGRQVQIDPPAAAISATLVNPALQD